MLKHNIQIGHSIGFSFTPLDGKRPILKEWQSRPRESLREALEYADQGNVGLRCGSVSAPPDKYLVVIDEDSDTHLNLPPTVTVQTGRGRHYYFYSDQPIGNSSGKLGPHIDVRGEGGQVVYPGSIHPDRGTLYDWMTGMSPTEITIADLPYHIARKLLNGDKPKPILPPPPRPASGTSYRYALAALEYECANVRNAPEGSRNDTLNTAAFKLGTFLALGHLARDDAEQGLLAAAAQAGLPRGEALATIKSGLDSGLKHPREIRHKGTDPQPAERAAENRPIPMTDLGNAQRLVFHHGHKLRYCHPMSKWSLWTGKNWTWDDTGTIFRYAEETIQTIWDEVNVVDINKDGGEKLRDSLIAWFYTSQGRGRIDAMIHLSRSLKGIPVTPGELDQDKYLFNCANGTLNLRTGQLQPHDPNDHITKISPVEYDPDAACPIWLRFLDQIMDGNPDLIAFLQQLTGYCLSADITEQIFVIFYGSGANGKSTFVDTITGIMGDYAAPAAPDLLVESNGAQHPTEIADLMGKRMAYTSETDEDVKLKTSLVKKITGETFLKARFMRQDHFTFNRTHKIIMQTNHKPTIRDANNAIWRRIRLVPFTVEIPERHQDKQLLDKLRVEWPGILAWAVRGFADWQAAGRLISPAAVLTATEDYRDEQNPLGEFLEEYCLFETYYYVPSKELWEAYEQWCKDNHEKYPIGRRNFSNRIMSLPGIKAGRTRSNTDLIRVFNGIGLKNNLFYQSFTEGLDNE